MKWYVYRNNMNKKEIEHYDVFNHSSFKEDVEKLFKKKLDKKEFSEELRKSAMYYFWSKCEHEVIITSWPPHISEGELNRLYNEEKMYRHTPNLEVGSKIDIYDQLRLNWDVFVDYVYDFQK